MWLFRELECAKRDPQMEQLNGFSPVWTLMCVCRLHGCVNCLSQMLQCHGFSFACTALMCLVTADLLRKRTEQWEHTNGFSPVWTRIWLWRPDSLLNDFSQLRHWKSLLSALWTCTCSCSVIRCLKPRPHTVQMWGLSSECVRSWNARVLCWAKRWLQPGTLQANGRSPVCVSIWELRFVFVANACPHWLQTWLRGFGECWRWGKCVNSCRRRLLFILNNLEQTRHSNMHPAVLCRWKLANFTNRRSQRKHL